MNKDNILSERDSLLKRKLLLLVLFVVYGAYIVNSCAISPMYTITSSDIMKEGLSLVFYFAGVILDLFAIFVSLAIVIYGMCRLSARNVRSIIVLILVAPFVKNILKLIVSPIVDGYISPNQLLADIYSLSLSSVLEALQLAIIMFLAYIPIKKYRQQQTKPGAKKLIPFNGMFDLKNPLQFGAFISSLVITVIRILMWVINDMSIGVSSYSLMFFLPYVLELVAGIIGYLFMSYFIISLGSKDEGL